MVRKNSWDDGLMKEFRQRRNCLCLTGSFLTYAPRHGRSGQFGCPWRMTWRPKILSVSRVESSKTMEEVRRSTVISEKTTTTYTCSEENEKVCEVRSKHTWNKDVNISGVYDYTTALTQRNTGQNLEQEYPPSVGRTERASRDIYRSESHGTVQAHREKFRKST